MWLQPAVGSQASVVHTFLSSQLAVVPLQTVALHASDKVHALLSLHVPVLATFRHFFCRSLQLSSVQTLASSQLVGVTPGVQVPVVPQKSPAVQKLPSVHAPPPLPGVPPQMPTLQTSLTVQSFLSEHVVPSVKLLAKQLPVAGSHESAVHGLPSSHTLAVPGLHTLAAQMSPVVHAFLSLQPKVLAV